MEKLQYALLDIITKQNDELEKFKQDCWYGQWKIASEENKALRKEISEIYKDIQELHKELREYENTEAEAQKIIINDLLRNEGSGHNEQG